jgi:hypothetical protein
MSEQLKDVDDMTIPERLLYVKAMNDPYACRVCKDRPLSRYSLSDLGLCWSCTDRVVKEMRRT